MNKQTFSSRHSNSGNYLLIKVALLVQLLPPLARLLPWLLGQGQAETPQSQLATLAASRDSLLCHVP